MATELCIRTDGDEGLLASYSDVQFLAPVRAGDVLEIGCDAGPGRHPVARRSSLTVHVVARGEPTPERPGAAALLDPPLLATTATATVVVPPSAGETPAHWSGPGGDTPAASRIFVNCVNGAWPLTCMFSSSRRSAAS